MRDAATPPMRRPEVLAQQLRRDAGQIDWVIIDAGETGRLPGRRSTCSRPRLNSSRAIRSTAVFHGSPLLRSAARVLAFVGTF